MKNVEEISLNRRVMNFPIKNVPPSTGWSLRYVSGADAEYGFQPGYMLTRWEPVEGTHAPFDFGDEHTHMIPFDSEADAEKVSDYFLSNTGIKTEVIKVG